MSGLFAIVWNRIILWMPIFGDCEFFCFFVGDVISWMRPFSVSVVKMTLSKFVKFEDLNSWRGLPRNTTNISYCKL